MSAEEASELFRATYGRAPDVVASAPGRVNLIGEHTDYNGGEVLPIAIGRRTWVAMAPGQHSHSRACSRDQNSRGAFDHAVNERSGAWWDYVHGTMREVSNAGLALSALDIAVASDVPQGAGLSSSAALEVATAVASIVVHGHPIAPWWDRVAKIAHLAETQFVGVPSGIMDQSASCHARDGQALRIWCDSGKRAMVPFERSVLVIDTAMPRELRASAFADRQAACHRALLAVQRRHPEVKWLANATLDQVLEADLSDADRRRARHVVTETGRVGRFVDACSRDEPLGGLLRASQDSLRDDYECSSPQLDWVVDFASREPGVDGARLTGAGWGGCAIVIGAEHALKRVAEGLPGPYRHRFGLEARTWLTKASHGARIEGTA